MSTTPTTCPHCGAEKSEESDADIQVFECGTEIIENEWQSIPSDCYERQIAALKAELEQAKAERQWRPIETAPKESWDIILCDADGWRIIGNWWRDAWRDYVGEEFFPTHWMPLPPAPKEAQP